MLIYRPNPTARSLFAAQSKTQRKKCNNTPFGKQNIERGTGECPSPLSFSHWAPPDHATTPITITNIAPSQHGGEEKRWAKSPHPQQTLTKYKLWAGIVIIALGWFLFPYSLPPQCGAVCYYPFVARAVGRVGLGATRLVY